MKYSVYFFVMLLLVIFSCKKDKQSDQDSPVNRIGVYDCTLRSRTIYTDSTHHYVLDTSYSVLVEVTKIVGNTITLKLVNGISEPNFDNDSDFSGARIHGSFFKKDSLYIDNSHPGGIYSYVYRGKKVD